MPYKKGQKWVAQVRINGKRKEKIFLNKKDAVAWESESWSNPDTIWPEKTNTVSLFDWSQTYLDYSETAFAEVTYGEKKSVFKRFFKSIDPCLAVNELTPAHVEAYVVLQKTERSGYAANKDRKNLLAAWEWGMEYMTPKLPKPNPCQVKKMPEVRQPRYVPPEADFWNVYDVTDGQDRVMLLAFLHLAARRGEIFRVKWEDIDFSAEQIRLWTRKREGGHYEYDWLPMTQMLKEAFLWWQESRPIKDSPYVFLCLDEKKFCEESYGKPFMYRQHFMMYVCARAGVKKFGFHAIRHLTATVLYKLGIPIADIQMILRHQSATTTAKYLKSLSRETVRPALEAFSQRKSNVLMFKPIKAGGRENQSLNEKAVSGAVIP